MVNMNLYSSFDVTAPFWIGGWYLVRQIQLTRTWCTSPRTVQHIHHRISWRACRSRARLSLSNPLCFVDCVCIQRRFKTAHGKRALTIELCARLYLHMYGVVHLQKSHLCAPFNSVMGCCCFLRVRFSMLSARIGDVVFGISCMQCKCNFMPYTAAYMYTVIFCLGRDYILILYDCKCQFQRVSTAPLNTTYTALIWRGMLFSSCKVDFDSFLFLQYYNTL